MIQVVFRKLEKECKELTTILCKRDTNGDLLNDFVKYYLIRIQVVLEIIREYTDKESLTVEETDEIIKIRKLILTTHRLVDFKEVVAEAKGLFETAFPEFF